MAVGAPPIPTFEYADVWRSGNDIAVKPLPLIRLPQPTWSFVANQARQFTSRWPFCLATLCDADPVLLRRLPREQVEVGAWVALSTGGALFLSDDLTRLPEARRSWGLDAQRARLGLGGVPATPESFFPEQLPERLLNMKDHFNLFNAEHHVPSVWRLPDGTRLAFNFARRGVKTVEGIRIPARAVRVLPQAAAAGTGSEAPRLRAPRGPPTPGPRLPNRRRGAIHRHLARRAATACILYARWRPSRPA